ncbi:MAG: hypothetical protein SGJ21_00920, partial [Alphaproteobacteria bacterium]|nr:hypothetical protein [Alphaproteobacteria bacterium]
PETPLPEKAGLSRMGAQYSAKSFSGKRSATRESSLREVIPGQAKRDPGTFSRLSQLGLPTTGFFATREASRVTPENDPTAFTLTILFP